MSQTITERCGCGAEFTYRGGSPCRAAREWREGHKHAESVGICGDRPPPIKVGDHELSRPYCVLRAGHEGMHADDNGGHWRYAAHESAQDGQERRPGSPVGDPTSGDERGPQIGVQRTEGKR